MDKSLMNSIKSQALALRPRTKLAAAVVTSVGAAFLSGLIWFYLNRRKKSGRTGTKPKKDGVATVQGGQPSVVPKRGPSPAIGSGVASGGLPPSKPSSTSLLRRRGSTSRSASGSAVVGFALHHDGSIGGGNHRYVVLHAGLDSLTDSITHFERTVRVLRDTNKSANRQERELLDGMESALETTKRLQSEISKLLERCCPEALEEMSVASTLTPMGSQFAIHEAGGASNYHMRRTLSVLSDESFASALDDLAMSFPEVEEPVRRTQSLPYEALQLYQIGMEKAMRGEIQCRCLRTELLHCISDDDFLAKLYCVREGLAVVMQDESRRQWIAEAGRELLSALLVAAKKSPSGFQSAFDAMLAYVKVTEDWTPIEDELSHRQVMDITFYDVVLDFILMDAFDDLSHPPASVLAVIQNRFLGASFKESTLSAVVWSVVKAKRTRLHYSRGFISHFYDISEQLSPTLAWGFLGTDEHMRELCYYFKDQVTNFLSDIFSADRVRYTSVDVLAEDIYQILQSRLMTTKQRLIPQLYQEDGEHFSPPGSPAGSSSPNGNHQNHHQLGNGNGLESD